MQFLKERTPTWAFELMTDISVIDHDKASWFSSNGSLDSRVFHGDFLHLSCPVDLQLLADSFRDHLRQHFGSRFVHPPIRQMSLPMSMPLGKLKEFCPLLHHHHHHHLPHHIHHLPHHIHHHFSHQHSVMWYLHPFY